MKTLKKIALTFFLVTIYSCSNDDSLPVQPEPIIEVTIDGTNPNLILNNNLIINYGKQRNKYTSNGNLKWEVRYKFCFNAPLYNSMIPSEVRVYSKKENNIYYQLYKGPLSYYYNDPSQEKAYFTSLWQSDTEASLIQKEHRIEFLYPNGIILYQELGTNYTCEGFNELSCFECQ